MAKQLEKTNGTTATLSVEKINQYESPEGRMCLVPKVRLEWDHIITSAHSVRSKSMLIDTNASALLSEQQVVVAAGPGSPWKVGDWVQINVDTFPKSSAPGGHDVGTKITIHPPLKKIGNTEYLYMMARSIQWEILK